MGGAFAFAALGALVAAATELREHGHLRLSGGQRRGPAQRAGRAFS